MNKKYQLIGALLCVLTISGCAGRNCNSTSTGSNSSSVVSEKKELMFNLNDKKDGYIVTGIGTCDNFNVVVPDKYNNLPVKEIGNNAFYNCDLTSILIPDSITDIGVNAFYGCNQLTIYCEASSEPNGWSSDWNCCFRPVYWGITAEDIIHQNSLQFLIADGNAVVTGHEVDVTNVVIPSNITVNEMTYSVTSIGQSSFENCSSLTSIMIPNSITDIYNNFFGCEQLTIYCEANSKPSKWSSDWNNSFRPVYWGVTQEDIIYQNGLQLLIIDGDAVVTGHEADVTKIVIPSTIIAKGTMYNVTSINYFAFAGCTNLNSVTIPNSVTNIDGRVFEKSNYLIIYCEASSKPSGWNSGWSSYMQVYWGVTQEDIIYQNGLQFLIIDDNAVVTGYTNELPSELIMPSIITVNGIKYNVTSIGRMAFCGHKALTSIVISKTVTSIGTWAFASCQVIIVVTFEKESELASIDESAFDSCINLRSVTFAQGSKLVSIGESAFESCYSLTSILIPNSVTNISNYAFFDCESLVIYCEASSKPNGWSSNWNWGAAPVYWGVTQEEIIYQNDLQFLIVDDNVVVTGHTNELRSDVIIPSTIIINGEKYSVTSIGTKAFYNCDSLITMLIPNSVEKISSYAFDSCGSIIFYCEASSKPSPWDQDWNQNRPVYWANEWSYVNGLPTPNEIDSGEAN